MMAHSDPTWDVSDCFDLPDLSNWAGASPAWDLLASDNPSEFTSLINGTNHHV